MAQVALRRAVSLNPSSPGGLGASWVISWMTAGKRGRGSRSDSDEGQYPAKKGEFSAYRDRTTNRAPIRPSDHRRVVANQVQRIAAPTRIGCSNAHVSVILPYSGP